MGPIAAPPTTAESSQDAVAAASQQYFQAVTNYLNDLFFGDRRPQNVQQTKVWVERYAHKIEDLEHHEVDEEVIDFGGDVVAALHEIVSIVDRARLRSDLRESDLYDADRRRYGRYGAYGYYEKQYASRDRQIVQTEAANRGVRNVRVVVEELRELSAQTRQTMTQRYQRPF